LPAAFQTKLRFENIQDCLRPSRQSSALKIKKALKNKKQAMFFSLLF
jgi:hypothetical protein